MATRTPQQDRRGTIMKHSTSPYFLALMLASNVCWPYGDSGGTKACTKPKFSDFIPAENAEIAADSPFSFTASKNTYPSTIKVTVKDMPAMINVTPDNDGSFRISGTLPGTLADTYARIAITADGQGNCKGSGGWLVKVR